MNHLGDTNKMVSDTPRTDAEYERLFEIYRNWERKNEPLCCSFENDMRLCRQLERELNAANREIEEKRKDVVWLATEKAKLEERIKRLEDAGDALENDNYTSDNLEAWRKAKEAKL